MCDEYEDERMAAVWRRLEELQHRDQLSPKEDEAVEPLVRIESDPAPAQTTKPRTLAH